MQKRKKHIKKKNENNQCGRKKDRMLKRWENGEMKKKRKNWIFDADEGKNMKEGTLSFERNKERWCKSKKGKILQSKTVENKYIKARMQSMKVKTIEFKIK